MSDSDSKTGNAASPAVPSDGSGTGDGKRPGESWLDRIRTAVGMKSSGSIRTDLAAALASNDVTAAFTPEERSMLGNILRLREMRVDDIMVPRADIDSISAETTLAEALAAFRKSGHSRLPVFRETLDDPVGLVHVKDLMEVMTEAAAKAGADGDGESSRLALDKVDLSHTLGQAGLVRNILFVPASMRVAALLANMQASRMQMALVIDEYGGTDGLVSLEDAVEVIVGEIEDEYDEEAGALIEPDGKGGFLADARASLEELAAAVGTDLAAGEGRRRGRYRRRPGLLHRRPHPEVRGELIPAPGDYEFEVLDADPRRVKRVLRRQAAGGQGRPAAAARAERRESPPAARQAAERSGRADRVRAFSSASTSSVSRGLADAREDLLDGVAMIVEVAIGHRIGDGDDVKAMVEGVAGGRLDAAAGGDAGEKNLGDAAAAQDQLQGGPVEGADLQLRHRMIARLAVKLRDQVCPVGRRRKIEFRLGAAGGHAGDIDQDDRQFPLAESTRETADAGRDLRRGMGGRHRHDAFLHVDDDERGDSIDLAESHGDVSFGGFGRSAVGCHRIPFIGQAGNRWQVKPEFRRSMFGVGATLRRLTAVDGADIGWGREDCGIVERDDRDRGQDQSGLRLAAGCPGGRRPRPGTCCRTEPR